MATIKLTQDFKEFLNLLNSEKIEYLLIGGYAVALYGVVRPTKDMDIWIATSDVNLRRVIEVLGKFGFRRDQFKPEDFTGTQTVFRMGVPPDRLELITRIAGVSFDECYLRRRTMDIDGVPVSVIDYEDLKRNKLATGRVQDQADIARLEKRVKAP
jgi:hypothetical protein